MSARVCGVCVFVLACQRHFHHSVVLSAYSVVTMCESRFVIHSSLPFCLLPGNFATLVVATAVLEGLGRSLDPGLNLVDAAIPYFVRNQGVRQLLPSEFSRDALKQSWEALKHTVKEWVPILG